jgi:hypothetical protein
MQAPAIRVTCECGTVRSVPYGERWECETCGRRWNTEQIPAEAYTAHIAAIRRYRRQSVAFLAVMLGVFVPLTAFVDTRFAVTGIALFFLWSFLVRPRLRRRLLATVRGLSRWELHPE